MELEKLMQPDEAREIGIASMTDRQRETLLRWGMRMYSLGQHVVGDIDEIKFDGRLIILEDGSRWEVDSIDVDTADTWSMCDKVVVIDGEMFRIEDAEKITVQEYFD
jgi:hypothetical protein